MYTVRFRDSSYNLTDFITVFDYLSLNLDYVGVSSFTFKITVPRNSPEISQERYYERIVSQIRYGWGLVVYKEGIIDPIFSGEFNKIRKIERTDAVIYYTSGFCDLYDTAIRLIYPTPGGMISNKFPDGYDVQTGTPDEVIKGFVSNHCGPSALPDRKLIDVIEPADNSGGVITKSGRFQTVLDMIAPIAKKAGLGFRVVASESQKTFGTYKTQDLSGTRRFSFGFGNLIEIEYSTSRPTANAILAAGQGELADRYCEEAIDYSSLADYGKRIEKFVDARNDADADLLETAQEQLLEASESVAIGATISEEYLPIGEVNLGDLVSVEVTDLGRRLWVTFPVSRYTLTISGEQFETVVHLGRVEESQLVLRALSAIRGIQRRLAITEAI